MKLLPFPHHISQKLFGSNKAHFLSYPAEVPLFHCLQMMVLVTCLKYHLWFTTSAQAILRKKKKKKKKNIYLAARQSRWPGVCQCPSANKCFRDQKNKHQTTRSLPALPTCTYVGNGKVRLLWLLFSKQNFCAGCLVRLISSWLVAEIPRMDDAALSRWRGGTLAEDLNTTPVSLMTPTTTPLQVEAVKPWEIAPVFRFFSRSAGGLTKQTA